MRKISLFSFVVLLLAVWSWQPQNGFTAEGPRRIELPARITNGAGHSDLWIRNLSARSARLAMGGKAAFAREDSPSFAPVAGETTVRIGERLPETLRSDGDLILRSDQDVAMILAPADFPVDRSQFFHREPQQQSRQLPEVPAWVRELGAIGKTGANVLKAKDIGSVPVVRGPSETHGRYVLGIGVALSRASSTIEVRLLDKNEQVIKSVVLASSAKMGWQAELGEFDSDAEDFPGRAEIEVLAGSAQGFLSIKNVGSGEVVNLPIAARNGRYQNRTAASGGGTAYFTNGVFDSRYSSYSYQVDGAPPNVCGTLHIIRNGVEQVTPSWICTDSNGSATKGPWTPSSDQTGQSIYIEWPDSSRTTGGDYKVDDASDPIIGSNQEGGIGIPIPDAYYGSASDTQWGSGFDFTFFGWSGLAATFLDVTTGKYYNGQGYIATSPIYVSGSVSPSAGGFNISWSVTPPPANAHNSTDTYEWCVRSNDYFYSCFECIYFYGPR